MLSLSIAEGIEVLLLPMLACNAVTLSQCSCTNCSAVLWPRKVPFVCVVEQSVVLLVGVDSSSLLLLPNAVPPAVVEFKPKTMGLLGIFGFCGRSGLKFNELTLSLLLRSAVGEGKLSKPKNWVRVMGTGLADTGGGGWVFVVVLVSVCCCCCKSNCLGNGGISGFSVWPLELLLLLLVVVVLLLGNSSLAL